MKKERMDITEIIHANECACMRCREFKKERFRVVKESEPRFDPAECDVPWYYAPQKVEYEEYTLNWRYIGNDEVEFRYELHHKGKM